MSHSASNDAYRNHVLEHLGLEADDISQMNPFEQLVTAALISFVGIGDIIRLTLGLFTGQMPEWFEMPTVEEEAASDIAENR